jgi:hypothetical protein
VLAKDKEVIVMTITGSSADPSVEQGKQEQITQEQKIKVWGIINETFMRSLANISRSENN